MGKYKPSVLTCMFVSYTIKKKIIVVFFFHLRIGKERRKGKREKRKREGGENEEGKG